jgi:Restriction endonuclease
VKNSDLRPLPDDEDPPHEPMSEKDWQAYEHAIARIEEQSRNGDVLRDYKIKGRRSGVERQVDVWLSSEVGDGHSITVAIECRRYGTRAVSIKDIDAFFGFLDDVGANKGVMISRSGFTSGATKRAAGANIELRTLSIEEAEDFDWDEFVRDTCQTFNHCLGTVNWQFSSGSSEAGYCGWCGSLHIRCGNCGEMSFYNEDSLIKCDGCMMRWRLAKEKGEVTGITEMPPDDEDESEEDDE